MQTLHEYMSQAKANADTGGIVPHPLVQPLTSGGAKPLTTPMEFSLFGQPADAVKPNSAFAANNSSSSSASDGAGAFWAFVIIGGLIYFGAHDSSATKHAAAPVPVAVGKSTSLTAAVSALPDKSVSRKGHRTTHAATSSGVPSAYVVVDYPSEVFLKDCPYAACPSIAKVMQGVKLRLTANMLGDDWIQVETLDGQISGYALREFVKPAPESPDLSGFPLKAKN